MKAKLCYHVSRSSLITGELLLPGDKSISHRAALLGALAEGSTVIKGFLQAEDTLATLRAIQCLGIKVDSADPETIIHGKGLQGLLPPAEAIDCGNSGTSMRLLTGVLAGQHFDSMLTGDESLLRRPMGRVVNPLREMGAKIDFDEDGTGPLAIHSVAQLNPIYYTMPIASAQVKSCLLLAALFVEGETTIVSPISTRDHTERMLEVFDYDIHISGPKIRVKGHGRLYPTYIEVPGDISSAAFFIVAATLVPRSHILLKNVGINPYRIGIINILRLMGGHISFENEDIVGGELVADIRVKSASLHGIDIPLDQVPLAIDEFPVIFIAAACAQGVTILRGAEELHVKESDRIQVMAEGLQHIGIRVETHPDGMSIEGGKIVGGTVNSYGDHRVAMSFAIAGTVAENEIIVTNCENVPTSFPNFVELAKLAGIEIEVFPQQ
ncbi:MAG: 3-phosphoshikimate 1-carboxyvinyltransferase [Gammaproteobacteria bacterium]|nr:3-phosphoshikimate 1-carboxyvinyltransferase [Gammaproteobacteria bacterium]